MKINDALYFNLQNDITLTFIIRWSCTSFRTMFVINAEHMPHNIKKNTTKIIIMSKLENSLINLLSSS